VCGVDRYTPLSMDGEDDDCDDDGEDVVVCVCVGVRVGGWVGVWVSHHGRHLHRVCVCVWRVREGRI
jgi:ketosteroid isomerase-like protein